MEVEGRGGGGGGGSLVAGEFLGRTGVMDSATAGGDGGVCWVDGDDDDDEDNGVGGEDGKFRQYHNVVGRNDGDDNDKHLMVVNKIIRLL